MTTNEELNKTLNTAKIMQVGFLASILIFIAIIKIVLPYNDFVHPFPADDPIFLSLKGILGVSSIGSIIFGYYFPRMIKERNTEINQILVIVVLRAFMFNTIAINGLLLGILGAKWQFTMPFYLISAVVLILTFPTYERLEKINEQLDKLPTNKM